MSYPKGLKSRGFPQGTDDSKNLRCETLCTVGYEYVNISCFSVLDIKLSLEEDLGGISESMDGWGCAILALEFVPKNLIFT